MYSFLLFPLNFVDKQIWAHQTWRRSSSNNTVYDRNLDLYYLILLFRYFISKENFIRFAQNECMCMHMDILSYGTGQVRTVSKHPLYLLSVSKANMAFVYNKIKTYLSSFQFCYPFKHVNEIDMRGQVSYNSSIPCLLKVKSKFH